MIQNDRPIFCHSQRRKAHIIDDTTKAKPKRPKIGKNCNGPGSVQKNPMEVMDGNDKSCSEFNYHHLSKLN